MPPFPPSAQCFVLVCRLCPLWRGRVTPKPKALQEGAGQQASSRLADRPDRLGQPRTPSPLRGASAAKETADETRAVAKATLHLTAVAPRHSPAREDAVADAVRDRRDPRPGAPPYPVRSKGGARPPATSARIAMRYVEPGPEATEILTSVAVSIDRAFSSRSVLSRLSADT